MNVEYFNKIVGNLISQLSLYASSIGFDQPVRLLKFDFDFNVIGTNASVFV